ncbi:MAG: biopolymer transporter ExbD [Deltaproteobacteria bacterium]|nr:biopolymer transporter ExbD [Deltaproteobacteria bacterium]
MKSSFGSGWTTSEEVSDINIVPLVDVLLVLLVIFMITAPIIAHTLDVKLPSASLSPGTRTNQTLVVSVDRNGQLAVNEKLMGHIRSESAMTRFEKEINGWKAMYPGSPAFLRADHRIRYGTVIMVMARLRKMGVVNVGLMIEREGG